MDDGSRCPCRGASSFVVNNWNDSLNRCRQGYFNQTNEYLRDYKDLVFGSLCGIFLHFTSYLNCVTVKVKA